MILASLLALVGCQSEKLVDDGGSLQGQQFSLTASKSVGGSRTAIINGQTVWSEGDRIYVSSADGRTTGVLTLDPDDAGSADGTFTGFVFGNPDDLAYSVFPAPKNGTTIDLSTIEGGGEVDAPFIGYINTNDAVDVHFEHVCGVAPIVMNGYNGGNIEIKATNNNSAVKFLSKLDVTNVDLTGDKPKFITGTDETESITITSPKGGQMYVPYYLKNVPTSDNVVVFKHGEKELNKADLSNGFVGKVHSTTVVAHTFQEDGSSVVNTSTKSELKPDAGISTAVVNQNQFKSINDNNEQETAGDTHYFNVSGIVTQTTTGEEGTETETIVAEAIEVTLPKVVSTGNGEESEKKVEISFTNVTPSTAITIQEDETDPNQSIDNLTVVLPSGTTEEEAKEKIVINMPNTTVTVKSDDGKILLIEEMDASTAPNTLVIEKGVVVKKLNLQKGSLQVFGHIEHLVVSENKENVLYIVIEVGGSIGKITGNDGYVLVNKNEIDETIIIPNPGLSRYLYDELGSDKVTINPETQYAEMKKSDVVTVNEIVVNNYDEDENDYTITSLDGIEHFVNLTKLMCNNVGLEAADLSKNVNLKDVDLNFNDNLASLILPEVELSTVEVSNCSKLTSLNIKYPNSIVSLNYSHTNVTFTYDQLAEFTSMKKLGCAGRFNGTLNVPNSIKANLETLICQNNALTELDMAEYPNLVVLECYWNELTTLDLALAPNLVVLRCFSNQMTELNIIPLDNLSILDCGNQQGDKTLDLYVADETSKVNWENYITSKSEYNKNVEVSILVTIENVELSAAIMAEINKKELELPGEVKLNKDNYAVMKLDVANAVEILKFNRDESYTITSLHGIEHFQNLKELVCESTGLTEANLSSNTELTYLDVNFNGALSSLNINGLVNLTTLKYNETAVTTLAIPEEAIPNIEVLQYGRQRYDKNASLVYVPNVNEFTSLKELACYGQEFTLTNSAIKAQLLELQCYMCEMSKLNLAEYPSLYGLICYANNLTELIIPKDSNIGLLCCYANKLTTLDVTPLGDTLFELWCGSQENSNNNQLTLSLTEEQKAKWDSYWNESKIEPNVKVVFNVVSTGEDTTTGGVTNGNTSGEGFKNGGEF